MAAFHFIKEDIRSLKFMSREPIFYHLRSIFHITIDRFNLLNNLQWDGPIILFPTAIINTILSANCKKEKAKDFLNGNV